MEGMKNGIIPGSQGLKRYYFYFCVASVICLFMLTTGVLLSNYATSLRRSVALLEGRRAEAAKIDSSLRLLKRSVSETRAAIPASVLKESPERLVLISLDKVKRLTPEGMVTVTELQTKENETILPVTLKGLLFNYSGFLGMLGSLQSMRFPFMVIDEIRLAPGVGGIGGPAEAGYEIRGVLKTPDLAPLGTGKGD
jgi:hypothetical protein